MELRHLRHFVKLAEALHFRRAAEVLNVSQPTLSLQIKQLEDELGARLFDRSGRKVQLTPSGSLLLPHAMRALGEIQAAEECLRDVKGILLGDLKIGITHSFRAEFFPNALGRIVQEYPSLRIKISVGTNDQIQEAIKGGQLDLGLICVPSGGTRAASCPLFMDGIVVVASKRHRLARARTLHVEDLENEPLVLPTAGYQMRRVIDAAFAAARVKQRVVLESDDIDVLLRLVSSGVAATIISGQAAAYHECDGVVRVPLEGSGLQLTAVFIWPKRRIIAAAQKFVEVTRDVIAENAKKKVGLEGRVAVARSSA